jgi:hypothetical protein
MEFKDLFQTLKITRYGIVLLGILILLKTIPNTSMSNKDIIVSTIVLFSLYIVVENVFTKSSFCGTSENLPASSSLPKDESDFFINKVELPITESDKPAYDPNMLIKQTNTPSVKKPNIDETTGLEMKPGECTDCVRKTSDEFGMDTYMYDTNVRKYESGPTRAEADVMKSEMQYTDYNILPITKEDSKLYEYGYSFLPPEKWYPTPAHPPVCVSEKRSPVFPITTTGTPVDMKEWDSSRRITPGDVINIDYARDKLNSGR